MELCDEFGTLLNSASYDDALALLKKPESVKAIRNDGIELLTIISEVLSKVSDVKAIETYRDAISYISNHANPRETLLMLMRDAEAYSFQDHFYCLLDPLLTVLRNLRKKRIESIVWVSEFINERLKKLNVYSNLERTKTSNDPRKAEFTKAFGANLTFYSSLVCELNKAKKSFKESKVFPSLYANEEETIAEEKILKCSILDMLDRPLVYFDLTWSDTQIKYFSDRRFEVVPTTSKRKKTVIRLHCEKVLGLLKTLGVSPSNLMEWVEKNANDLAAGKLINIAKEEESGDSDSDYDENGEEIKKKSFIEKFEPRFNTVALANYFYLYFAEQLKDDICDPSGKTPTDIFNLSLPLINSLLREESLENFNVYYKGILLAKALLDNGVKGLSSNLLDTPEHKQFYTYLINLLAHSSSTDVRRDGLQTLKKYLWAFKPEGRFNLLLMMLTTVRHTGIKGYIISQAKDMVRLTIDDQEEEEMKKYVFGKNLTRILEIIFKLEGERQETMLIDKQDEIVSALNLFKYLLDRDRKNETGFGNSLHFLEKEYISLLRFILNLCLKHYKERLEILKDPSYVVERNVIGTMEASAQISGLEMDNPEDYNLTKEEETNQAQSALLAFDLISSILAGVSKSLDAYKLDTSNVRV